MMLDKTKIPAEPKLVQDDLDQIDAAQPEAEPASIQQAIAPRPVRRWRALVFQGYLLTAAITFLVLFGLAGSFDYLPIDLIVTRAVQTITVPWALQLMISISTLGYAPQSFILTAAIVLLIYMLGLRWEALAALIAAGGVGLLGYLVKLVVHRPRPSLDLIHVFQQLDTYSFPSGHVLFYTAFFGFLLFLAFSLLKPAVPRTLLIGFLGLLIGLIGASRIYLGEHWASDVLGAYTLGSLWLTATVYLYRWGKPRFGVHQTVASDNPGPAAGRRPQQS